MTNNTVLICLYEIFSMFLVSYESMIVK